MTYAYNANGDLSSDGLRNFYYDTEGRLSSAATGFTDSSPVTRYVHNALGQRVFKTEPLYPPEGASGAALTAFFSQGWAPSTGAEMLGYAYAYDEAGTLVSEIGMGGANSSGGQQFVYLPKQWARTESWPIVQSTPMSEPATRLEPQYSAQDSKS